MKIVTRGELIARYKKKYKTIITDPEKRLEKYFSDNNLDFDKAKEKAKIKLLKILENVEYKHVKITLYEYPMKTDRPRTGKHGTYSPNAKDNKRYLADGIKTIKKALKLINTPAEIHMDAYLEMPAGVKPDEVILYEAKILKTVDTPDYDNIEKCYTDMQKDNFILDDDIFYKGNICRYYSLLPRVEIFITYQTKHDSEYVFKKMKNRKGVKEGIENGTIKLEKYY